MVANTARAVLPNSDKYMALRDTRVYAKAG